MSRTALLPAFVVLLLIVCAVAPPVQAADRGVVFEGAGTIRFADAWSGTYCDRASALLTVDAAARVATYTVTFPPGCEMAQALYLQAVGTAGVVFALVWGSWEEGFTGISGAHVLTVAPPDDNQTVVVWGVYFWPLPEPFNAGGPVHEWRLG